MSSAHGLKERKKKNFDVKKFTAGISRVKSLLKGEILLLDHHRHEQDGQQ